MLCQILKLPGLIVSEIFPKNHVVMAAADIDDGIKLKRYHVSLKNVLLSSRSKFSAVIHNNLLW